MSYISLVNIKEYLGVKTDTDDKLLESLRDEAEAYINRTTNRIFEADSGDSTRYYTPGVHTRGVTLYLDEDLSEITTVLNGDSVEITSAQYTYEPFNRTQGGETVPIQEISILASSGKSWQHDGTDPERTISVAGKWGYALNGATPDNIKSIMKRLVSWNYYQAQNKGTELDRPIVSPEGILLVPLAIPEDVRDKLKPYMRGFG